MVCLVAKLIYRTIQLVQYAWSKGQGKVFTHDRIGKIYDWVYFSLLKKAYSIKEDEWGHGMYYPTKWDLNFDEFMTLAKLFHYPVIHFNFHLKQITRR